MGTALGVNSQFFRGIPFANVLNTLGIHSEYVRVFSERIQTPSTINMAEGTPLTGNEPREYQIASDQYQIASKQYQIASKPRQEIVPVH